MFFIFRLAISELTVSTTKVISTGMEMVKEIKRRNDKAIRIPQTKTNNFSFKILFIVLKSAFISRYLPVGEILFCFTSAIYKC